LFPWLSVTALGVAVTDDSTKTIPRDPNRVSIHDFGEVEFWCKQFRCSRAQLVIAVHSAGVRPTAVGRFLREVIPAAPRPATFSVPSARPATSGSRP
jgi:hypothetical protein